MKYTAHELWKAEKGLKKNGKATRVKETRQPGRTVKATKNSIWEP